MKYKKYIVSVSSSLILVLLFLPSFSYASLDSTITISNPFNGGNDLLSLITAVLNKIVLPIAAVASVFWVILAGFKYVQAKGNPKAVEDAHANLLWSLIGIGVVLGAAGISAVVQSTVKSFLN
jgi:hypothetical protein